MREASKKSPLSTSSQGVAFSTFKSALKKTHDAKEFLFNGKGKIYMVYTNLQMTNSTAFSYSHARF
jgi:hypothetical protein